KVKFVIETNYFTTSMSKIREVVRHFMELKKSCMGKYKLIYITDGMGWFGLAKDVKRMLEFEIEEQKKEPSQVRFLMNLEIFRQNIDLIKNEMRR
ncbi:MAG: DpnII family type II restriction endonuclease, partial [Candidatus Bathyarchaeia archaeon]